MVRGWERRSKVIQCVTPSSGLSAVIEWLVSSYLTQLAVTPDGWSSLFRDPADGRIWELTYPSGGMHGGGPPSLALLSRAEAERRYRVTFPDT